MSENDDGQEKKKTIRVEVDRSPEIEQLRLEKEALAQELTEKRAILEKQALTEIEKSKTEIMDMARIGKLTDEQLAEIEEKLQDPKNVEPIRKMVEIIKDNIEKVKNDIPKLKIPYGKASLTAPTGKGTENFSDEKELISELYKTASDRSKTPEERKDAQDHIDILWKSLLKNPNKRTVGKSVDVSMCPQCNNVNESARGQSKITCGKCGFEYKV